MATRFTPPRSFWVTSAGLPQAGGKLQFYETDTTTPLDTYSDNALSVANTNPVIADSSGLFGEIFLKAQDYKVVFSSSDDTVIFTADPVRGSTGGTVAVSDIANGTDGEIITWGADGVATTVAVGTANHVLTSNGAGSPPTFQVIPVSTTSVSGSVELATDAEVKTGTDTARVAPVSSLVAHEGVCKAWVVFNGTGTLAISDSFNITSVTDNGTGNYTVTFATDFGSVNYTVVAGGNDAGSVGVCVGAGKNTGTYSKAAGSYRADWVDGAGSNKDFADATATFFGDR